MWPVFSFTKSISITSNWWKVIAFASPFFKKFRKNLITSKTKASNSKNKITCTRVSKEIMFLNPWLGQIWKNRLNLEDVNKPEGKNQASESFSGGDGYSFYKKHIDFQNWPLEPSHTRQFFFTFANTIWPFNASLITIAALFCLRLTYTTRIVSSLIHFTFQI